jgi:hypothetical protein
LGDGDHDQGDEEPGPVASSTSDATGAGRGRSMLAFRSVVSVLLRALGDFSLHPQGRPCGRPLAAAVLGRQRRDGQGYRPHPQPRWDEPGRRRKVVRSQIGGGPAGGW